MTPKEQVIAKLREVAASRAWSRRSALRDSDDGASPHLNDEEMDDFESQLDRLVGQVCREITEAIKVELDEKFRKWQEGMSKL